MRIGIIGTTGGARDLGERLAQAGHEVEVAPLDQGDRRSAGTGTTARVAKPPGASADRDAADAVFVDAGGGEVPAAIEAARPLVGPRSVVVPLVDSAGALGPFVAAFGAERVVAGRYALRSWRSFAPGELTPGELTLGEIDHHASARVVRLARTMEEAGVAAAVSLDIHAALAPATPTSGPTSGGRLRPRGGS
jgi:2-dehydropantoate 2-reductase